MISGENLFSNFLTVIILLGLFLIVYAKITNKTLVDIIRDLREGFSDRAEEISPPNPMSFEQIR